jgi:ornithine cyclodeaminase/alanine dehydrogenase
MGCKLIAASPRAMRASYLVSLFNQESMNLDALLDGNQITGIRTAATAVVAIDALTPNRPLRVGVLGSGFEARAQLTALLAARVIERVRVFSPTPEKRLAFVEHFRQQRHTSIEAASEAKRAVAGADLVICAARARAESPILLGTWLEPGMTITSIGSTLPEQREVEVDVIARANLIVADNPGEVAEQTGDMIAAKQAGIEPEPKMAFLGDIVARRRVPRSHPSDIVLYKSVGSALQDVVIAEMLLLRARQRGVGTILPVSIVPVAK